MLLTPGWIPRMYPPPFYFRQVTDKEEDFYHTRSDDEGVGGGEVLTW
jgi:hypothetical protein